MDQREPLEAEKKYQVEEIVKLFNSPTGLGIRVRELELIYPTGAFKSLRDDAIRPYIESEYAFVKPLVELADSGQIPKPSFNVVPAHLLPTEVFILAGRWDEAVDYRTSIALAYSYPKQELFIADDNHVFARLRGAGLHARMVQAFLQHGLGSAELRAALDAAAVHRWTEEIKASRGEIANCTSCPNY